MFSNETIRKLREIHMGVMAEQLSAQLEDPQFRNVPFEDRLAMLVDAEWSARKSNRLTGLIKKASYADTQASVENIEYSTGLRTLYIKVIEILCIAITKNKI